MSGETTSPVREPFFIRQGDRRLFALHDRCGEAGNAGSGVVFLPPFAEEMNRSRRMATLLAREAANTGHDALVFDLFGTGDSSGEFAAARWSIWQDDAVAAVTWLSRQTGAPVTLVGLRFGAFLAVHLAEALPEAIGRLVLWQPVASGRNMLTQFLRIRVAAGMARPGDRETTQGLWARLEDGQMLEVAGYELAPDLARDISELALLDLPPPTRPVHWVDLAADVGQDVSPGSRRILNEWREKDVSAESETVIGEPFWSLQETTVAPALIARTCEILAAGDA